MLIDLGENKARKDLFTAGKEWEPMEEGHPPSTTSDIQVWNAISR